MIEKTIKIKYEFGSDFQEKFANESLRGIMDIYKKEIEKHHKNNKVDIIIEDK